MKKITLKSMTAIASAICLGLVVPAHAQWTTGTNIKNTNTGTVGINMGASTAVRKLQVHSGTSRDQLYVSGKTPSIFLGENISIDAANNKVATLSMTTEANMYAFGTASGDLILSSRTGKLHFISGGSHATSGKIRMSVGTDRITVGTPVDAFGLQVLGSSSNCLKLKTGTDSLLLSGDKIESSRPLSINASSMRDVSICPFAGNVGIGKSNPSAALDVVGSIKVGDNGLNTVTLNGNEIDALAGGLYLNRNSQLKLILCQNGGPVGIGTNTPSSAYKLSVNGGIRAKEITVETMWSDFVFEKNYRLRSLTEVEDFINQNGHLPEIPAAKEVAENGVKLGEIESKLLMKIEELTLYLIKQEKRISELENRKQ